MGKGLGYYGVALRDESEESIGYEALKWEDSWNQEQTSPEVQSNDISSNHK